MKKQLLIAICSLLVVLCSYSYIMCSVSAVHDDRKANNKRDIRLSSPITWSSAESLHYPIIPNSIKFTNLHSKLPLLREARDRKDIVAWVDNNPVTKGAHLQSIKSQNPNADWFLVTYIWTSGSQTWNMHLYCYYPLDNKDPKPWKLFYIGSEGLITKHINDIECIYIDSKTSSLVFAKRTGEKTKRISIKNEMVLLNKRM